MEEISSQNSDLGLEDLDKLEAKGQAENSKRATSWGIKKFEKWCDKRKLKVDFNCVTPVEPNELLRKFYAEVKSEKGQPLTPRIAARMPVRVLGVSGWPFSDLTSV